MKRLALALAATLALAGCGGGRHVPAGTSHAANHAPASSIASNHGGSRPSPTGHACDPSDYAMQCALSAPPPGLLGAAPSVRGLDFGWSSIGAATARADGFRFAASYLSSDASKNWTRGLIRAYHAAGLATVNVWETSATRALSGFGAGQADARSALAQSLALGSGYRPIYFAIDFDETPGQAGAVAQYFRGIHSVLDFLGPASFPTPVPVGAYGGYWAIKRLFDAHLIGYGWQTYAWSGGLWDRRAQIQQYLNGSAFDYDRATAPDYGQTPYRPSPAYPVCFSHRIPAKLCAEARARITSDRRAAASSQRALAATGRALAAKRCVRPYRRAVCVHKGRDAAVFAQRARYFTQAANRIRAAS